MNKKYRLVAVIAVVSIALPSFAQPHKRMAKEVVADTVFHDQKASRFSDFIAADMLDNISKSSKYFYNNAMSMLDMMPSFDVLVQSIGDSAISIDRDVFIDSTGRAKHFNRKAMVIKRPHGQRNRVHVFADSLTNSQSVVVFSDGNKTTIIQNGKDTIVVDSPTMPNMNFDMFTMPPRMGMMPRWFDRDFNMAFGEPSGFEAENPSEQELEMLKNKSLIPSVSLNNPLDIYDLKLRYNSRSRTLSLEYRAADVNKTAVKIISQDGKLLDEASLLSRDGVFRRTFKATDSADYVYIAISSEKKFSVSKFWL